MRNGFLLLLAFCAFNTLTRAQNTLELSRGDRMSSPSIRYVGGTFNRDGKDIGTEINAAYKSLPSGGGAIVVLSNPTGRCYDFVTPITAAVPGKYLLLMGGALPSEIPGPSAPPCLNYEPTTLSSAITLDYSAQESAISSVMHGIRDLILTNNGCQTPGGCGSDATGLTLGGFNQGANGATLQGVRIVGFGTGVSVLNSRLGSGEVLFEDCTLSYNDTGFADSQGDNERISFDRCSFVANGTGLSSGAPLTIVNSSISSNVILGISCVSPAVCNLNNDHLENGTASSTHFLNGDGVFSILGGDMRDMDTAGITDWWMNFVDSRFSIVGTSLTTAGRIVSHVIRNESQASAAVQTNSPAFIANMYSNPQLGTSAMQSTAEAPNSAGTLIAGSAPINLITPAHSSATNRRLPQGTAVEFGYGDSIRYVSAIGNDSNDGLSPSRPMATVNRADTSMGKGGDKNGAIILLGQVMSKSQVKLGPRHALMIYGSLQISHPILMGDGATIDCIIPRGSPGNVVNLGGIVAASNMEQMIRGITQDGTTEMFTIRNCGLDGGYHTFSAPGLIDTTGMNDRTTVENNEIIHFSGSACIGAANAPANSTSFQLWSNNWCNATGKNAACGKLIIKAGNSGSINNIDIENLECGWTSTYGFLIHNPGTLPSNAINNITFRGLKGLPDGDNPSSLLRIDNAWQVTVDNPHLFNGNVNVVDVSDNVGNIGIVLSNVEDNSTSGCYIYDHLNGNCVTNESGGHAVLPFYAVWNARSPNAIIGCASVVCGAYTGRSPTIFPATGFDTGSVGNGSGSKTFTVTIGVGASNNSGTLSLPGASHGWACGVSDLTNPSTNLPRQSGGSSAHAVFANYDSSGTAKSWVSGDTLLFQCEPY